MGYYFDDEQSIYQKDRADTKKVINKVIDRYMADNKEEPYKYFVYPKDNYTITEDYLDEIKIHEKFPNMKNESYSYAFAMLNSVDGGAATLRLGVYGPVFLYINGELAYRSNSHAERFSEQLQGVNINLKKGQNSLLFLCIKTPLGCGIRIGSNSYKGRRIQFFAPTKDREGMGGFIYSEPIDKPLEIKPQLFCSEESTGIKWFPEIKYTQDEDKLSPIQRIFNTNDDKKYIAYTYFQNSCNEKVSGYVRGKGILYFKHIDDDEFESKDVNGIFECQLSEDSGKYQVVLFGSNPYIDSKNCACPIKYESDKLNNDDRLKFLYAGSFDNMDKEKIHKFIDVIKPIDIDEGQDFWYIDKKNCRIRPYNEGVLFGEWSYPLGVTLYGILKAGQLYEDEAILKYVGNHFYKTVSAYDYCIWDKKEYGASAFLHQLLTLDCLDDCGSFASAMLEYQKGYKLEDGDKIADVVGEFIRNEQYRLVDGTFYRDNSYFPIMNNTIWADDMYMSIPFLCRYYQKVNDEAVLDDIIHQVKRFVHYLFMPKYQIMSHIYDTHYNVQTEVPWGRGNGWTIFSITELLLILPKEHKNYNEIVSIYQILCQGYLKLQDNDGMWHQVLTMESSYPEASCTAMFTYAFAYGVINNWFDDSNDYAISAQKGFEALCKTCIDVDGNLFGVCRGSGYSFSKEYYAKDLGWNKNDTHGTGIVILAGVAVENMKRKFHYE